MTQETVKALTDAQLVQVIAWSEQEQKERAARHKQETIAKIKEMAQLAGVSVSINGRRGRPSRKAEVPLARVKKA